MTKPALFCFATGYLFWACTASTATASPAGAEPECESVPWKVVFEQELKLSATFELPGFRTFSGEQPIFITRSWELELAHDRGGRLQQSAQEPKELPLRVENASPGLEPLVNALFDSASPLVLSPLVLEPNNIQPALDAWWSFFTNGERGEAEVYGPYTGTSYGDGPSFTFWLEGQSVLSKATTMSCRRTSAVIRRKQKQAIKMPVMEVAAGAEADAVDSGVLVVKAENRKHWGQDSVELRLDFSLDKKNSWLYFDPYGRFVRDAQLTLNIQNRDAILKPLAENLNFQIGEVAEMVVTIRCKVFPEAADELSGITLCAGRRPYVLYREHVGGGRSRFVLAYMMEQVSMAELVAKEMNLDDGRVKWESEDPECSFSVIYDSAKGVYLLEWRGGPQHQTPETLRLKAI